MRVQNSISVLAAILPVVLGFVCPMLGISFSVFRLLTLTVIGLAGVMVTYLAFLATIDGDLLALAAAIMLSTFCTVMGEHRSRHGPRRLGAALVVFGLSLGALLAPKLLNTFFLSGMLGFAAYALFSSNQTAALKTISLVQMTLAMLLSLVASVTDHPLPLFAGLFLGATLVPLFPFHLPFVSLVGSAQGTLSGLWTTAFLSLGLAELKELQPLLSEEIPIAVSWLALAGALYASVKSLGQAHIPLLITYATVAQVSLLWGFTPVFSQFSTWGIQFGITIALVMTGLFVTYTFIQQRYGSHAIGMLPGLASPMPRLGTILVILISIAMLLPVIPIIAGVTTMPTIGNQDVSLVFISLITFSVWMLGSWYFSHLLHQTAFGKARHDIPYRDLKTAEIWSLALLILGAGYSGLFY